MRLAQADSKAAAVMNEVDAVIRRIAKPLLMASDFLEIGPDNCVIVFKARRHTPLQHEGLSGRSLVSGRRVAG